MASKFKCNECGEWTVLKNGLCKECRVESDCWACTRTFSLYDLRHDGRCAECDDADCDEQTCSHTPFDVRFPGDGGGFDDSLYVRQTY